MFSFMCNPDVRATFRTAILASSIACLGACSSGSGSDNTTANNAGDNSNGMNTGDNASGNNTGDNSAGMNSVDNNTGANTGNALTGTWTRCKNGLAKTFTFKASRWTENLRVHMDEQCSGAGEPFGLGTWEGTYELVGEITTEGGLQAQQIDMTSDKLDGVQVIQQVSQYDIVYTGMPGQLIFAESTGRTAENRPTKLDFEFPYLPN